jgi:hypothetical protein
VHVHGGGSAQLDNNDIVYVLYTGPIRCVVCQPTRRMRRIDDRIVVVSVVQLQPIDRTTLVPLEWLRLLKGCSIIVLCLEEAVAAPE